MARFFEVELRDGQYRRKGGDQVEPGTVNELFYALKRDGEIIRWDTVRTARADVVRVEGFIVYICPRQRGTGHLLIAAEED